MRTRTVLFTAIGLTRGTGSETYTRDLATALLRLGWRPVVYTLVAGRLAEDLRRRTIPVIDDLEMLSEAPDLIHGHQSLETLTALVRYPAVPALFVVHGGGSWNAIPPVLDRVRAYVAVDENCRDRAICEYGVPAARTRVLPNAVDLQRFRPRPPLPPKPAHALVFSNGAREDNILYAIRQACAARGIEVDVAGAAEGRFVEEPERLLPHYDLVFAKARCALEALAVGNAVVLCDYCGLGPMVTSAAVEDLRRLNLGVRTLHHDVTAEAVGREIDRYDAADAAATAAIVRRVADLDALALQFIDLYDEICRAPVAADSAEDAIAIARYLRLFSTRLYAAPADVSLGRRVIERLRRSRAATPVMHRLHRWLDSDA
jgi:glycosyltransferase involved in cell wall biosynthesis